MRVLTAGGGNLLEFNGVRGFTFDRDPHDPFVCTLEPPSNRTLAKWGIVKRPRIYNTGVSYEHAASAGGAMYWLVRTKPKGKKRTLAACSQLPNWGRAFGFDATPISDPPGDLLAETAPWFGNSDDQSAWFEVSHADKGLGLNFAVVGYLGHHLRHLIGPSFESMHLIAQIEGEPNFRRRWHGGN